MKCKKVTRVIYLSSEWSKKPSEDWAMTVDARGLMTPAAWRNKNISGKTVINNNAQGWRLRNVSLRIKLSISALVCLETWKGSKNKRMYEIFLYFCFVLFFFSFSATANFWNRFWEEGWFLERKNRDRSKNVWMTESVVQTFFMFCCCCFTWGVLTAPEGERKTGEKAGRKRKQVDQWM